MVGGDARVLEGVLSKLVAYNSLLTIKDIIETKYQEKKKELEKMEREGRKVKFLEQEEEKKAMTTEEAIIKKRIDDKLSISQTFHFSEAQKEKELQRLEIEKYGVINCLYIVYRECGYGRDT